MNGRLEYIVWRYCSCSNETDDKSGYDNGKDARRKEDADADQHSEIETGRIITRAFFESVPTFQYSPLSKPSSIRLVRIDPPGDTPDIVYCFLVEVDLARSPGLLHSHIHRVIISCRIYRC